MIPVVESIPTAARAIPNTPALRPASPNPPITANDTKMPMQIRMIGSTVDFIPTERPEIIVVAWPVSDCLAISLTEPYLSEV